MSEAAVFRADAGQRWPHHYFHSKDSDLLCTQKHALGSCLALSQLREACEQVTQG